MQRVIWTWDEAKNQANKAKHRLTFETACLVFDDSLHQTFADPCETEDRWQTFGMIQHVLIVVVHTDPLVQDGVVLKSGRIISARKATSEERRRFEEQRYG